MRIRFQTHWQRRQRPMQMLSADCSSYMRLLKLHEPVHVLSVVSSTLRVASRTTQSHLHVPAFQLGVSRRHHYLAGMREPGLHATLP
jgi:hypothetical protein